jgi:hypothetical protein
MGFRELPKTEEQEKRDKETEEQKDQPKDQPEAKKPKAQPKTKTKKKSVLDPLHDGFIHEKDSSAAFRLIVYDSHRHMIMGESNWRRAHGYKVDPDDDCLGVCYGEKKLKTVSDKDGDELLLYGTMFLNIQDLRTDPFLVIHESLHEVIDRERSVFRYEGQYGDRPDNGNDPEERICYCLEDFVRSIYKVILGLMPSLFVAMEVNLKEA